MARFAAFCLAVLLFAYAASPVGAADAKLLGKASQAVHSCGTQMPDTKALAKDLKTQGFGYDGFYSGYEVFSTNNYRVVAATTFTSSPKHRCMIVVSKMTTAEAEKLIQPWIKSTKARQLKRMNTQYREIHAMWEGTYKGAKVRMWINKNVDLGVVSGAAILAGEL